MAADWFKTWFDTKYYHILYKNRNEEEAALFLDNLLKYLKLKSNAKIWDMACGKGRHIQYLASKGFDAYGTDISENSIKEAIADANVSQDSAFVQPSSRKLSGYPRKNNLPNFSVHDMRSPFRINYFDCALNIFTSLGYFDFRRDDERVFISASQALKPGGRFVVDYLNAEKVLNALVPEEVKTIDGVTFHISRKLENKTIVKTIRFEADKKEHIHEERVKAWTLNDFTEMANAAALKIKDVFGDYWFEKFQENSSERLILIMEK